MTCTRPLKTSYLARSTPKKKGGGGRLCAVRLSTQHKSLAIKLGIIPPPLWAQGVFQSSKEIFFCPPLPTEKQMLGMEEGFFRGVHKLINPKPYCPLSRGLEAVSQLASHSKKKRKKEKKKGRRLNAPREAEKEQALINENNRALSSTSPLPPPPPKKKPKKGGGDYFCFTYV